MRQGNIYLTDEQWRLVEENMGLVGFISDNIVSMNPEYCSNYNYWYEEFFSEGKFGLISAASSYNDSIGEFSTYACICIRRKIFRFLRKEYKHNNVKSLDKEFSKESKSSLHDLIADPSNQSEEVIDKIDKFENFFIETINIILNCLNKKEGYTIISRYLLKMTQECVASKIGCSQQNISNLEKKGIGNLKKFFSRNKPYDKSFYMEKVGSQYVLRIQLDEKDHYWQKIKKITFSPSISCTRNEKEIKIRTKYLDKKFFILLCDIIQIKD